MLASSGSETNPNALWLNSRGMWAAYTFSVFFLHFLVNCIPVLSVPMVWTLTHTIHNVVGNKESLMMCIYILILGKLYHVSLS